MMMDQMKIWWGWVTALAGRVRSERGVTVEQVLWIVFWVAAVGIVSVAVMSFLNGKVALIR